jgi:hypothetical protein
MADIGHRCTMASQDFAHNPMHQIILPLRWKAISLAVLCIAPTVMKSAQALEVLAYANSNIHATEVFDTDSSGSCCGDGDRSTAAFVSFDYGKQTFKAMLADTGKFFVEYYAEEETSAITAERAGSEVFDTDSSGGHAVAAGVSLNFAW